MSVNSKMTAIADAIREKTGSTDLLSLDAIEESISQVFDLGKEAVLKGLTNNYTRKSYGYSFQYTDLTGLSFKETVKPTNVDAMFQYYAGEYLPSGLDFSDVTTTNTSAQFLCRYALKLKIFPDINYPVQTRYAGTWQGCPELETIEIVRSDENTVYQSAFWQCYKLKNIAFDGVIGQDIDFQHCVVLSKESILNVFEHLSDTAAGMTATFSQAAVIAAFGSTGAQEWLDLIATKTNWTISLV